MININKKLNHCVRNLDSFAEQLFINPIKMPHIY